MFYNTLSSKLRKSHIVFIENWCKSWNWLWIFKIVEIVEIAGTLSFLSAHNLRLRLSSIIQLYYYCYYGLLLEFTMIICLWFNALKLEILMLRNQCLSVSFAACVRIKFLFGLFCWNLIGAVEFVSVKSINVFFNFEWALYFMFWNKNCRINPWIQL